MRNLFSRIANVIAPRVCEVCAEGSGMLYNEADRSLTACPACEGTGRAEFSGKGQVIDLVAMRAARIEAEVARDAA